MSAERRRMGARIRAVSLPVALLLASLATPAVRQAHADEPGMIGVVFRQIYSDIEPNHHGPLVALQIVNGSPAEKAGIHCSDFVVAVNGHSVMGRELAEVIRRDIQGPAGGTVRLTILRFDGSQQDVTLVRAPIPPHDNPATDPFSYRVPGSWAQDSRYPFPLPWSPDLGYKGFEDLYFAPNFDRTELPDYHSYLFWLWLEGAPEMTAKRIEQDMLVYFRGLADERGKNYRFTPDKSQVAAHYEDDPVGLKLFGGAPAQAFRGTVAIWDTHGKLITLNSEAVSTVCPGTNHTLMFFGMSLEPRDGEIWKEIDRIRDTFRCGR